MRGLSSTKKKVDDKRAVKKAQRFTVIEDATKAAIAVSTVRLSLEDEAAQR